MNDKINYLVFGSAHLDILSEATGFMETTDKPGKLSIEVGGSAYNLGINLLSLGCEVTFYTAFNSSSISKLIINEMESAGMNVVYQTDDSLPDSGFSAHIVDRDLISAVSSISIESYTIEVDDQLAELVRINDYVVLDCNLNIDSLINIINLCREYNTHVSLALVSESKALKLTSIPPPDITFCNFTEHQYLLQHSHPWQPDDKTLSIVTNGIHGAMCYRGYAPISSVQSLNPNPNGNMLGAGDAFASGALFHFSTKGFDQEHDAMLFGAKIASRVIEKGHCNLGKRDILNKRIEELSHKANNDPLTGLLNRAGGHAVFSQLQKQKIPYTMMMLDIDHFKKINDNYGHDVGDIAIKFLSTTIQDSLRNNDFAIRWGGEEFIIVFPIELDSGIAIAERLCKSIRESGPIDIIPNMTVSIGVDFNDGIQDPEISIKNADQALYYSKENGRDQVKAYKDIDQTFVA